MGQFGDKFRSTREKKGISLDDVSNVTKISSRMLQAIEQEQFDQLPGGVFNRGFIRAYAKHLGLNDEDAVTDYLACLRQAQIDAQATWQPEERPAPVSRAAYTKPELTPALKPPFTPATKAATNPAPKLAVKPATKNDPPLQVQPVELPELQLPRAQDVRPPRRDYAEKRGGTPWTVLAAGAVVVVLAAALWLRHSRSEHPQSGAQAAGTTGATTAASPAPQSALPIAAATTQAPSSRANANASSAPAANTVHPTSAASAKSQLAGADAASTVTVRNDVTIRTFPSTNAAKSASITPMTTPPANPASSTSQSGSASSPSASPGPTSSIAVSSKPSSLHPSSSNPSSAAARPLTLVIRAAETSWISVTADGQTVSQETLIAPAHASIRASREIVARVGNAAGVSFLWNGQEIPAQGAEAEVKTYVFDAQGMREVSNQPPVPNQ